MYHKVMYLFYREVCKVLYHRVYRPLGDPASVKAVIKGLMRHRGYHRDFLY